MKKLFLFLIALNSCFCICACEERIDTLIGNYKISIIRESKDKIHLKYKEGNKKEHNLFISALSFNDIIFQDTSIIALTNNRIEKHYRLYLHNDILILPLNGLDWAAHIIVINLKTEKILSGDIRNVFELLYLKKEDNDIYFITSNLPILEDDGTYSYDICEYKIQKNKIRLLKIRQINLKEDIRFDNLDVQCKLIQDIWKIHHLDLFPIVQSLTGY